MSETDWVRTFESGNDYLESLGGVLWADAPLPAPWHKCQTQTRGWFGLNYAERCACGARRDQTCGPWINRNETRQSRKRQRKEARMPHIQVTCRTCGSQYEAIKDSGQAQEELCHRCWADALIASAGGRR